MKIVFLQELMFESFGPMFVSALLKQDGHNVEMLIPENDDWMKELSNADIVMFSVMTSFQQWSLEKARIIKEHYPNIITVFGGPHATFFPEMAKEPEVDYVIIGEGEKSAQKLINCLSKGEPANDIPGLGTAEYTNPIPEWVDVNNLPMPDRSLYYDKYPFLASLETKKFLSGRGCPYRCTFCFNHQMFKMGGIKGYVRKVSVEKMIEEILWVKERYPLKTVRFSDDIFAYNKKWLKEFFPQYKEKVGLPFTFLLRADEMDDETVRLAKEAGVSSVYFGIESGSERVRNEILKKDVSDENIYRITKILH